MERDVTEMLNALNSGNVDSKLKALDVLSQKEDLETRLSLAEAVLELTRETVRWGRTPSTMTPLMKSILEVILKLSSDPIVAVKFTEGNILLLRVTQWFNKELEAPDLDVLLITIDTLTKGSSEIWTPTCTKPLIRICYDLIQSPENDETAFIYAVKILLSLCRDSATCYMDARADPAFKAVWMILSDVVFKTPSSSQSRKVILTIHLMFALEIGNNHKLLEWGIELAGDYSNKLFSLSVNSESLRNRTEDEGVTHLAELVGFLGTLLQEIKYMLDVCEVSKGYKKTSDVVLPRGLVEAGSKCKRLVIDLSKGILKLFEKSVTGFIRTDYSESVASLLVTLTPSFLPFTDLTKSYKLAFATMAEIMCQSPAIIRKSQAFVVYLHLITNVIETGGEALGTFDAELLGAVKHLKLSKSAKSNELDIDADITCCRILSIMSRVPHLADEVKRILDIPALDELLSSVVQIPNEHKRNDYKTTTFIVESIGVLSDHSQSSALLNLLMKFIINKGTAYHIASGILNGDEKLVSRALMITGSVAFARDSLVAVAKALYSMRAGVADVESPKFNFQSRFSPAATRGLIVLEESLETLALAYSNVGKEGKHLSSVSEVVELQGLKDSMHESEKNVLREQIHETQRIVNQLRSLTEKQARMMAKYIFSAERKDQRTALLSHTLEVSKMESKEKEERLQKNLNEISVRMTFTETKLQSKEESLELSQKKNDQLQRENANLKTQVTKTEALRVAAQESLDKVSSESTAQNKIVSELKKRISSLERDVRHKEEERKRFEDLLEKEKRTVDVIRGVLGNNIGSAALS